MVGKHGTSFLSWYLPPATGRSCGQAQLMAGFVYITISITAVIVTLCSTADTYRSRRRLKKNYQIASGLEFVYEVRDCLAARREQELAPRDNIERYKMNELVISNFSQYMPREETLSSTPISRSPPKVARGLRTVLGSSKNTPLPYRETSPIKTLLKDSDGREKPWVSYVRGSFFWRVVPSSSLHGLHNAERDLVLASTPPCEANQIPRESR